MYKTFINIVFLFLFLCNTGLSERGPGLSFAVNSQVFSKQIFIIVFYKSF